MTVREVVEQVITDLGNISIPLAKMESIGFPIERARQNLGAVIRAWDEEDKQKKEQVNPEEPEVKFEVVPAEDVPEEVRNNG